MKKEIKKLPKSKIEIEVEIPAQDWEVFLDEAAKELSNNLKVDGFRPGNMPRNIVERELGLAKIMERGSELAVRKTYVNIIIEDKIEAIGQPKITITKLAPGNPLVFKAEVVVLPEIQLPDYVKIAKGKKPKTKDEIVVDEKEIGQSIDWLRKSRAKYITVLREAKFGDRVEIDFESSLDGVKIDKGESKNHPSILGQSKFVKGFDDNLVGMEEGEEKNFSLVFPENYYQKHLAGKLVDFKVKMMSVQEEELPELNDQFAQSLGNFENIGKLKHNIREGILLEKEAKEKTGWQEEIINKIVEKSKMDLPVLLVDQEVERILAEIRSNVESFGLTWEKYLEELSAANESAQKGKTSEEEFKPLASRTVIASQLNEPLASRAVIAEQLLREKIRPQAEKRAKALLILEEIGKKEKVEVSPEELEGGVNKFLRQFSDQEIAKKQIDIEQLKEYTYGVLRNEKVFKLLESF